MKVMMMTPVFDTGGTEVYILNLINYLEDKSCDIKLLCGNGKRKDLLDINNINYTIIESLSKKSLFNCIKAPIKIYREIKCFKPQIIHTSSVFSTIIAKLTVMIYNIIEKENIKIILTLHGGPNKNIEKDAAPILKFCCDKVISLSYNSKKLLHLNGVPEEKIRVVYNGIKTQNNDNSEVKKMDSELIYIVSCGRLTEQKGYTYLLKALKIVVGYKKEFKMLILGEGELKNSLEKEVDELGLQEFVEFLGFKENSEEYIQAADIFVLPSLWEQFPISILEAMSYGKAIIASNVNGVEEQLGDTGILVSPKDINELAKALDSLIMNYEKRQYLGKEAKKRYNDKFTLNKMGDMTFEVYQELI